MHHTSDSDSVDSDEGIRYKTESIRNKAKKCEVSGANRNKSSHRSSSSHSHANSRHSNRSRRGSSSDSDRSRRKRYSSKKKKENSPVRDRSETKHKSEKRKKDTTYRERDNDIEKKEKLVGNRDISRHSLSSKTDKTSDLKMIACGPELPEHLQRKTEKQKMVEPITENNPKESNYLGPELPPNFKKEKVEKPENVLKSPEINKLKSELDEDDENNSVPTDEKSHTIGPKLPEHLVKTSEKQTKIEKTSEVPITSPLPDENKNETDKCLGPDLPPHLRQKLAQEADTTNDELEEEVYGPLPVGSNCSQAHLELEERALQMKINQLGPNGKQEPVREEWMVELPSAKAANLGLGPRQFRAKAGPDLSDRSSWTDTPQDKAKKKQGKEEPKVDLQREAELREMRKRDKEQEVAVKKSKRNKESLVNMHMKKMKDKKDSTASNERRPFNREVDLQVNRFDEAQKKAVLKKAQLLDSRFSSGESKFL